MPHLLCAVALARCAVPVQRGWEEKWAEIEKSKFDLNAPRFCDVCLPPRTPGSTRTHTHALHGYSASTRVITGNWKPLHPTPPLFFFYLHLFVYLPFHWVSWFSASLVFGRSAFFLRLCHVFSVILLSIFAAGTGAVGGGERETGKQFTVARRRLSCSFSAARATLAMPPRACGTRLSQPSSARILHGPYASGDPPLCVKEEVEWGGKTRQGEGRPLKHYMTRWWAEVGYFFSLSHEAQSEQSHPLLHPHG